MKFPQGTHEGGVIASIGVGGIMIAMFVIGFVGYWFINRKKNRNGGVKLF